MARINNQGYVEKSVSGAGRGKYRKAIYREWFFVTAKENGKGDLIGKGFNLTFNLPKRYIGKKIRIKIEIVE